MADADVIVLGAGLAGLEAARTARRRGLDVVVLEAADRVGGLAASFEVAGCRVDFGSHRLHPSLHPSLLAELRDLGVGLQRRRRHGRIRFAGRWVAFPLRAADLVRSLPPTFAARTALGAVSAPVRRRQRAATFAEAVEASLGPPLAQDFYGPYAEKLWGVRAEDLSPDLARRRVSATGPGDLLRRAVSTDGRGRWFWYPSTGFGAIAETVAAAAVHDGVDLRCDHRVEAVTLAGEATVVAGGDVVSARHVLSTLPLPLLARLVDDVPEHVRAAVDRLEYRAMVLVYLVVDRPRYTPFDAHYFPGPDVVLSRLSEAKNYRDSEDDPPGRTVLCAEIPCDEGDATWCSDAATLADRLVADLARSSLPDPEPVAVEVRRVPRVYPVYRRGFEAVLAEAVSWATDLPGLVTFGRPGLFVADNSHHVLAMGRAAGECLRLDGSFDGVRWRRALDRFSGHVVED